MRSCGRWSLTGTISSRTTSPKKTRRSSSSRTRAARPASTSPKTRTRQALTASHVSSYAHDSRLARSLQATDFHFVRDYEVVKVEQDVPNEFLLVFDEGNIKVEVQSTAAAATATGARASSVGGARTTRTSNARWC